MHGAASRHKRHACCGRALTYPEATKPRPVILQYRCGLQVVQRKKQPAVRAIIAQ
jgi:hypothetical protein